MEIPFRDRYAAGLALAARLGAKWSDAESVVLALPRGGVPVGFEVARALQVPLDIFLVRKLGVPGHEELGFGAIATGGVRVINRELVKEVGITPSVIDSVADREAAELERREVLYRRGRPPVNVKDRAVILVDDGLATGATMMAALHAVRELGAGKIVVAVPVAAGAACAEFEREADQFVCVCRPRQFSSVGEWYVDFNQTSDAEVEALLDRATIEQVSYAKH